MNGIIKILNQFPGCANVKEHAQKPVRISFQMNDCNSVVQTAIASLRDSPYCGPVQNVC